MKALLLAAGEGTRLRPLTDNMPKPMVPIAGRPILEHNIRLLAQYGVREIAINLHHRPDVIKNHFGDGSPFGVQLTYSDEPELLGTAGAVKKLESFFQDTFFVVYADNLIRCNLTRLLNFHHQHGGVATVALFHRDDVTQSGMVGLDEHDRVTRFVEKPAADQIFSHWVSAGLLVLEPELVKQIPSGVPVDFGREVLPQLLASGQRLYGYRMGPDEHLWWIDTTADLERVQKILQ